MGCMASKNNEGKAGKNIFHVINVDDDGNKLSPCDLEITDTEIILYQKDKNPIVWPFKGLRRYGFDSDIFSFEAGRRCITGPGIYAFKGEADQLFNMLQLHIQNRSSSGDQQTRSLRESRDTNEGMNGSAIIPHAQIQLHSETSIDNSVNQAEPSSNRLVGKSSTFPHFSDQGGNLNDGVMSNGVQDDCFSDAFDGSQLCNMSCLEEDSDKENFQAVYVNVPGVSGTAICDINTNHSSDLAEPDESQNHLYMNVQPERATAPRQNGKTDDRVYVNINQKSLLKFSKRSSSSMTDDILTSNTCDNEVLLNEGKQVNYVVLDLDPSGGSTPQVPLSPVEYQTFSFTDSPKKCIASLGYATIDFDKTAALSNSFNPNFEVDAECLRLTRHNVPHHSVKHNSVSSE